ncbi:hypothetical protein V5O48_012604, partial [Marasmius crinis-equi]
MPKPIPTSIDSGDDDPYSEDDMLWHRGGSKLSGKRGSATSFGSRRVNSANAFGNGGTSSNPYANQAYSIYESGVDSSSQVNAAGSEDGNQPPTYTSMTSSYEYDGHNDHSNAASIVGSSSYASSSSGTVKMSMRARIFSFAASPTSFSFDQLLKGKGKAKERDRLISTRPGEKGAGETETELDEPPEEGTTPTRRRPDRVDYVVSILWALLTAHQCLALTTGLTTRWRVYYPPLSTLIRLLALQAICWPATMFAMQMFD